MTTNKTEELFFIWNMLDDIPVNFANRVAFKKRDDAVDHLMEYMYGGFVVFQEDLKFKREWLDVVSSRDLSSTGDSFGEKLLCYYLS